MRVRSFLSGCALLLFAAASPAQPPADRDWGAALRQDAKALHDDIAANHPGPVNPADPKFGGRNDAQLAIALDRARSARSYADYFFALREYVAAFDDGHIGVGAFGDTPNDFRWPGFFTSYDPLGDVRVAQTTDPARVPVGAKLLGCDGMSAERYAAATVGKMWGRWQLRSQRLTFGVDLFLDEGSRYIPRAKTCRFAVDGKPREIALEWRPISFKDYVVRYKAIAGEAPRRFKARTLADGTRWYAMPSFTGDPGSDAGKALPPMLAKMREDRAALAAAPRIVLDLRGNGGGTSDWSRQVAAILWGPAAIERLPKSDVQVDWRVSRTNLDAMTASYTRRKTGNALSPEEREWFESVIQGLTAALARGDTLWRQRDDSGGAGKAGPSSPAANPPRLSGPVYLVTDAHCGSACLDAVDLWRELGAIHVGQTTSADTLYMDVRQLRLPSGVTAVSMPMKVYRGRPRGSNQAVVPVHAFRGDIADTGALERWIAALPRSGARRRGG